jgi:hypothetical protein
MKRRHRILSVALILCLLISCSSFPTFAASGNYVRVPVTADYDDAREVLRLINAQRTKRGLKKLKLDKSLTDSAVKRAAELMVYVPETSPHKRPNGKSNRTGNKKLIYECCAEGYESPKSVVTGWMNSPPHRKGILLSNAKSVGIGCLTSKNGLTYWTLEFGGPAAKKKVSTKGKVNKTFKINAKSTYLKKKNFYLCVGGDRFNRYDQENEIDTGSVSEVFPYYENNYYMVTRLRPSDFTWSSGDTSVATVDSAGKVTALKTGTVTIYAKMKDSLKYTLKVELTITEPYIEDEDGYYEHTIYVAD